MKKSSLIWKMVPVAVWWATWETNQLILEDKVMSFQDFKL